MLSYANEKPQIFKIKKFILIYGCHFNLLKNEVKQFRQRLKHPIYELIHFLLTVRELELSFVKFN